MLRPRERKFLLSHPELFVLRYFGDRLKAFPVDFFQPKLEPFHLRLIDAVNERQSLTLYPATHGKTTLISVCLPIWAICRNPNIRIVVIAKNDLEGNNIMQSIQAEFESNDLLIEDFGPFKPTNEDTNKPWRLNSLSTVARTSRSKEPALVIMGAGSNTILGHRSDWLICDDVVTERNSATPEQRAKLREWFNLKVMTSPELMSSRITVVGTLFDPSDLYHDLRELRSPETGDEIYKTQHEDAVVDPDRHATLWPERWPWVRLMEKKAAMGTLDFNKRFRNIAVDKSRMVFLEEYIRGGFYNKHTYPGCIDRSYKVGDYDDSWRRHAGFDPAVSVTRWQKFCAHVTLAVGSCRDHERCIWVVDMERDQMTLPQQVDLIIETHEKYDLFKTMVETNGYQAGLMDAINAKMEELGIALSIDPHYTTRTNKPDPETGVASMSRWFENGMVHIPWGDVHSQKKMLVLVDELVQFPGRYTDTVMAFWFAWRSAMASVAKYQSTNRLASIPGARKWSSLAGRRVVRNPFYANA